MAKRIFYYTHASGENLNLGNEIYPKVSAVSLEKAIQSIFTSNWIRFTIWEGGADKKHYKIIQKNEKWTMRPIPSREFDPLKWTKLKEICTRLSSYPKLPSPNKEMLLDFLDDHLKEARNIRNKLEIVNYLGEFWFERDGSEITISLRKEVNGRTYNIKETGIIEHFLLNIQLLEQQKEELNETVKSLKTPKREVKPKAKGKKPRVIAPTDSDSSEEDKDKLNKLADRLKTSESESADLKKAVKELKSKLEVANNLEKVSKLTQTVEELTGKLDKITSSFEASERENDALRKTIKGLKAELALAKADNSILRNELVISKLEPTATPVEEERVLNTDSMDPFECY